MVVTSLLIIIIYLTTFVTMGQHLILNLELCAKCKSSLQDLYSRVW